MSIIEIRDVTKRYSDNLAVDNVSLSIEEGTLFGLLGPNGAGKSTLISMLCGILSIDKGEITIAEHSIKKEPKKAKEKIGYVPQELALFESLSVERNLLFFGEMYGLRGKELKSRVGEALELAKLSDRRKSKVKTLSGGMKRRLNIVCAILNRPEILIMDEPTVGIDPQSRSHILEFAKEINATSNTTVIYITHYMEEVEALCNKIAIMDSGRVIISGDKDEIINSFSDDENITVIGKGVTEEGLLSLRQTKGIRNVSIQDNNLKITVKKGVLDFTELVNKLSTLGIIVSNISVEKPSLESVFLSLTGRALRD